MNGWWPNASRKPRFESTKDSSPLHWLSDMPLAPRCSQFLPASRVCQMLMTSLLHCAVAGPSVISHPSASVTKEISCCEDGCRGGSGICFQALPRSIERYRYWFSISTQMTLEDGALSCALFGRMIAPGGTLRTPGTENRV